MDTTGSEELHCYKLPALEKEYADRNLYMVLDAVRIFYLAKHNSLPELQCHNQQLGCLDL